MADQVQESKPRFSEGDTYLNDGDDYFTSGIDVGEHYNCIECYGFPEDAAIALRDEVLRSLEKNDLQREIFKRTTTETF